ncbi:hypothetical protein RvY_03060 [Ramazzottius varieornatus]|uniref:Uncharacterized protein n=1 Tax=Ramazzottius varieornatus TaxID=947166 RepID=A0A1D1UWZ7_RAMVA|nr:hypothetical protein RvY_03060 [Ramazzottius varieornatus]
MSQAFCWWRRSGKDVEHQLAYGMDRCQEGRKRDLLHATDAYSTQTNWECCSSPWTRSHLDVGNFRQTRSNHLVEFL